MYRYRAAPASGSLKLPPCPSISIGLKKLMNDFDIVHIVPISELSP